MSQNSQPDFFATRSLSPAGLKAKLYRPAPAGAPLAFQSDFSQDELSDWGGLFPDAPDFIYQYDPGTVAGRFKASVAGPLIHSPAFKRLQDIAFLGAIDYLFHPNGRPANKRHSRYDHSLGVALLAEKYCDLTGADRAERNLLVAAGLLHDIGHGPLSHTLEPEFTERFGINHHRLSRAIILGDDAVPFSLHGLLAEQGVDAAEVVAVLSKHSGHPLRALYTGPMNLDTFEGISRSKTYVHSRRVHCHPEMLLEAAIALDPPALKRLDRFWRLKQDIYRNFIYGYQCFAVDHLCRDFMARNGSRFEAADFLLTETAFRRKHAPFNTHLRRLKSEIELHGIGDVIDTRLDPAQLQTTALVTRRDFHINPEAGISCFADLPKRYWEEKSATRQRVGVLGARTRSAMVGDLFGETLRV